MSVNIYVGNLSYEMTENKLNELFSVTAQFHLLKSLQTSKQVVQKVSALSK